MNVSRLDSPCIEPRSASEGQTVEPWVETDPYGRVIDASPEGARIFNLTVRGLMGRNLPLFFSSRDVIADSLGVLRRGYRECPLLETQCRPMERKRRWLRVKMGSSGGDAVRWTFSDGLGDAVDPTLAPA